MFPIDQRKIRRKLAKAEQELERSRYAWPHEEEKARCLRLLGEPGAQELFRRAGKTLANGGRPHLIMRAANLLRLAGDEEGARQQFEKKHAEIVAEIADGSVGENLRKLAYCSFWLGRYRETELLAELYLQKEGDSSEDVISWVQDLARARRTGDVALAREVAVRFGELVRDARKTTPADNGESTLWDFHEAASESINEAQPPGPVAPEVAALFEPENEEETTGLDLSGEDLRGRDMGGLWLMNANLSGADLRNTDLTEAALSGSNLAGADLRGSDLTEASLVEADLTRARLADANLSSADLTEVSMRDADLSGTNLSNTTSDGVDFRGADLTNADLSGASLNNAVFEGATLHGTNLSGADMEWASLDGFDLRRTHGLRNAGLKETGLEEANLSGLDLHGCYMILASLRLADLSGANLVGADLREADLRGTNLAGADLRGTLLEGADLEGADLTDAMR